MNNNNDYIHASVMWKEILEYVTGSSKEGQGTFVDCTLGEGGHSELMLRSFDRIRVIAFERDAGILEIAGKRLQQYEERLTLINDNFSRIGHYLQEQAGKIDYILYDYGISSYHFDASGRGFAFSKDEPLDMRLDDSHDLTARKIVNTYKETDLANVIYRYGEERWSRRIAARICEYRKEKEVETTGELAGLVLRAIPKRFHVKNIHPATRVFQALRIEVNNELEAISQSLKDAYPLLAPGGRIMAMSFHSLEDRIVKNLFRRLSKGCVCEQEPKNCMCNNDPFVKILTKKPITAGMDEIEVNNRARSAKLRVCERV